MNEILTIGITTHGNKIAANIIDRLLGSPVKVIISEDLDYRQEEPQFVINLRTSGIDVSYIKSNQSGIANNRQNILNNVSTKYLYSIDNDDDFDCDYVALNKFLHENDYDVMYVRCYEDGKYMHIPRNFIYMCTWMQIFNVEWLKKYGGYVQSWNFIHEESATNLNLRANLGNIKYKKIILPKRILSYKYHANDACKVSFDVSQVCAFITNIPNNEKIEEKEKFLQLFKNFANKYILSYRINGDSTIMLSNIKNGSYSDIIDCIEKTKIKIRLMNEKKCIGNWRNGADRQ